MTQQDYITNEYREICTMTMQMNLEDYLSPEELKEIAADEFRNRVREHLKNEESFKRIITNAAYDMVWEKVDECATETIEGYLPRKVEAIIDDLSVFNIFKKPDAWSRETNSGYQILERCLLENKQRLSDKVVESIQEAPKKYLRELSKEAFGKIIERAITGETK